MRIRITPGDPTPIYQQIIHGVKGALAAGRLRTGEELPSIRALAETLTVNPNTVARAYRELETEGVVEKRRASGTFVSARPSSTLAERLDLIRDRADALLSAARGLGLSPAELTVFLRERWERGGESEMDKAGDARIIHPADRTRGEAAEIRGGRS